MPNKTVKAVVFNSISGEISNVPQGHICTFLRFNDCNLQNTPNVCPHCDTMNNNFDEVPLVDLMENVVKNYHRTGALCITGGEPLLYIDIILIILPYLKNPTFQDTVFIETNGTLSFLNVIGKCTLVVDWKLHLPEPNFNMYGQYLQLTHKDFIKFVIFDRGDLVKAINVQQKLLDYGCTANFNYSIGFTAPQHNFLQASRLASAQIYNELMQKNLTGNINVQLHKLLNFK